MGGFQAFAAPVTFPLGPLTLLYGPNSAGKSAILDAMLALADLCELWTPDKNMLAPERRSAGRILERHWRREGAMQAAPAKTLRLGAIVRIGGGEWAKGGFAKCNDPVGAALTGFTTALAPKSENFEDCFSSLQPLAKAEHVDVEVSFQYTLVEPEPPNVAHEVNVEDPIIELGLGGSPILKWGGHWAALNLAHPALLSWNTAADLKWLVLHSKEVGVDSCELSNGWFAMALCDMTGSGLQTNAVDALEGAPGGDSKRARGAEYRMLNMFDGLFFACLRSMRDALRVPVVPASRSVPRRSEVTFIFDGDAIPLSGEPFGLLMAGLPEHQRITSAAFARSGSANDPVNLVNRLLGDYLFQSSGYFVAAGIHELTAVRGPEGVSRNVKDRKFLVSLELGDSAGRRFNFDEVGSGLGYVLPVLLAIATSGVAFLQQPELHLHPALQSELADALIVALKGAEFGGLKSTGCRQIIAETHSEHLLLRLLRRVRQAADPDRSLDPHSLGREDLVVLYIDPKLDGFSTVKHLRVAEDGEFIDRWPRGFFTERDKDLFDE